jgi:hypothetical protein
MGILAAEVKYCGCSYIQAALEIAAVCRGAEGI